MSLTSHQVALLVVIVVLSLIPIISGIAFLYWHKITRFVSKKVYSIRFPHKIICAIIHYPGNKIDKLYKIIPDTKKLGIEKGAYYFSQDNLETHKELRDKIIFKNKQNKLCFIYEPNFSGLIKENMTKEEYDKFMKVKEKQTVYYLNEQMLIKDRGEPSIPEVHYWYNNPNPIIFDFVNEKVEVTSKDLKNVIESEVVQRLLKLAQQNMQMILLIILGGLCLLAAGTAAYTSINIKDGLIKAGVIAKSFIVFWAIPKLKINARAGL